MFKVFFVILTFDQEWLRWPYASELPGSHTVAIAAVDEAGNVDPMPAVWKWSVDARPRTSLDSAPQVRGASCLWVGVFVFCPN